MRFTLRNPREAAESSCSDFGGGCVDDVVAVAVAEKLAAVLVGVVGVAAGVVVAVGAVAGAFGLGQRPVVGLESSALAIGYLY